MLAESLVEADPLVDIEVLADSDAADSLVVVDGEVDAGAADSPVDSEGAAASLAEGVADSLPESDCAVESLVD